MYELQAALDLQSTAKDHQKLTQRSVLGVTPHVFVWKITLSVFFWITAFIVIAVVISYAGIDLFGLAKKLTSH